jgi:hydroxyethylthiazole kinase-like uncharacterized protein yjeF
LGESIWAAETVTFGLPKPFLFQGQGLEHSGKWVVDPIGFPIELLSTPTQAKLVECEWCAGILPSRMKSSHKGDNGHVLIIAGSKSMPGAAAMAARSALRSGAGLVTVAAVDSVCQAVASHLPECVFLPLDGKDGSISSTAADQVLRSAQRYDAAVVGPGLGQSDSTRDFLRRLWEDWDVPTVVDADALNLSVLGADLPDGECVLTPHPGEMSRLMESSVAEVELDRFATVRECAGRLGKCVLFKGAHTLISESDEPIAVNRSGNSGMATGGMGDVLSGVIATLMAQNVPAYHAAILGAFWHGLAGDICHDEIGNVGYLATDVADALPKARAKIVSSCNYEDCCSSLL